MLVTEKPRPLRVLHIGNVANYAYNIGKILQTDDIISHAISWDYYHINAQPIWEEGVFDAAAVGDHFFPKLPDAARSGLANPDWYVQGPRILACLTLIARNEGLHDRAVVFQQALDKHLEQIHDPAYRKKMAGGQQRLMEMAYMDLIGGFETAKPVSAARRGIIRILAGSGFGHHVNRVRWAVLNRLDAMRSKAMQVGASLPEPIKLRIKNMFGRRSQAVQHAAVDMAQSRIAAETAASTATPPPQESAKTAETHPRQHSSFEDHVEALIAQYQALHPDRDFDPMLLRQYEHTLPLMRRLFSHYDLIIGYAIEGVWPLMAGVPYVAYEFGTIRNLPFQDTPTGRLAALTYLNCEQTIVTNADNEAPAKRLGRPYFFLPHVVNESGLLNAEEAATARADFVAEHGGDFIVFHPPRQHWDEMRDTSWDKGNDHLFRGLARLVNEHAPNARCIAVSWGDTLKRSKELIAELGITANVVWITPQPHITMMRYIGICDVVCDQFTIPTFGGIPPKAFHGGKPVVTSFDPDLHRWCFDELPPLIAANSAEAAYEALARLYTDKTFAVDLGIKGADWYHRENSSARVRKVLLEKLNGLEGRA